MSMLTEHDEGVTVVVTRRVRAGQEAECETWMHGVAAVATRFPGHQGITFFRPPPGSRDWTFVFRFDSPDHLDQWERSPERADWVERARAFTERVTVHKHTGLETWFADPTSPVSITMPPRWKMVIVSWCVAFPLIQLLSSTLAPALASLPRLASGAIFCVAMVLIMTYAAMPLVTRALKRWLYA